MAKLLNGKKAVKNLEAPKADLLQEKIAKEAYFLAQQRGFEAGRELEDWLRAEAKLRVHGNGSRP